MERLHRSAKAWFEWLGGVVFRNPKKILLLVLLCTAAMISQVPKLVMDTSNESFFHPESDTIQTYNSFRDQYGREDFLIISIDPNGDVFTFNFLESLQDFHRALEEKVPYLDDVTSLINARNTRGEGDELIVEDLFEQWPQSDADLEAIRQRTMANPVYKNALITESGDKTAIVIRLQAYADMAGGDADLMAGFDDSDILDADEPKVFLTGPQTSEVVSATLAVMAEYDRTGFALEMSGMPFMSEALKEKMRKDMARFTLAGLLVITIMLGLMFRRFSGVIFPLLTIIFTLLSTLGLMALTGTAFKTQTSVLPSFLLAVSVGSAVHILAAFYKNYDSGLKKQDALVEAMGHAGLPVLMACLTTAVGLLSFSNAKLAPIAELGVFASLGVIISLLFTLLMIPALLSLFPVKPRALQQGGTDLMDWLLGLCADFSVKFAWPIIVFCTIGTVVGIVGVSKLGFYQNPVVWFDKDAKVRTGTLSINEYFKGVVTLEVVVDTQKENGLYDPQLLNRLDVLEQDIKAIQELDIKSEKTLSIVDILKEINQALHQGDPAFYSIPQSRELIAQELFLFESSGSDDLEDFVDSQFSQARYSIRIPWSEATHIDKYNHRIETLFREHLGDSVELSFTGMSLLIGDMVTATLESLTQAYLLAVAIISVLMILFIGDIKLGLISMIPNLSPIFMTLGIMGYLGMDLTLFTMFSGAIAIGLAVDDTLHFLHGFKHFHREGVGVEQAIRKTFLSTGRALLVTTVVLSSAFFIYMFGSLSVVVEFGFITGITIIMALFGDFILTPAILSLVFKDQPEAAVEPSNAGNPA